MYEHVGDVGEPDPLVRVSVSVRVRVRVRVRARVRQAAPSGKAVHGAADRLATAGWWQVLVPSACCRTQWGRHAASVVTWVGYGWWGWGWG